MKDEDIILLNTYQDHLIEILKELVEREKQVSSVEIIRDLAEEIALMKTNYKDTNYYLDELISLKKYNINLLEENSALKKEIMNIKFNSSSIYVFGLTLVNKNMEKKT